jgi:signal transduction histidine kinase
VQQNPLTLTVAHKGKPKAIHDALQHPLLANTGWPVGAIASIPLSRSGHVLGVLEISYQEAHAFAQDELRVLSLFAEQAAIAVENAQIYDNLRHASDTKNELASTLSHAFKVPMTSIQGYARLMALETGGALTKQQKTFLDTILRNVRQMNALVSDLLDLSRIEMGGIWAMPEPMDLAKSVAQAVRTVRRELDLDRETKAHWPSIIVNLAQGLPPVRADAGWLTRIWTHLIRNALQYTPDGGQIEVRAKGHARNQDSSKDDQWLLCAVKSSGIGFSAEEREKVFEPFYQVQHGHQARKPGTGLELAISRGVVELYGGRIWAKSVPGKGSAVFFTLPQA